VFHVVGLVLEFLSAIFYVIIGVDFGLPLAFIVFIAVKCWKHALCHHCFSWDPDVLRELQLDILVVFLLPSYCRLDDEPNEVFAVRQILDHQLEFLGKLLLFQEDRVQSVLVFYFLKYVSIT
jgi:hypothetical protein